MRARPETLLIAAMSVFALAGVVAVSLYDVGPTVQVMPIDVGPRPTVLATDDAARFVWTQRIERVELTVDTAQNNLGPAGHRIPDIDDLGLTIR